MKQLEHNDSEFNTSTQSARVLIPSGICHVSSHPQSDWLTDRQSRFASDLGVCMLSIRPQWYKRNPLLDKTWDQKIPLLGQEWECWIPMLGKGWYKRHPFLDKNWDKQILLVGLEWDFLDPWMGLVALSQFWVFPKKSLVNPDYFPLLNPKWEF